MIVRKFTRDWCAGYAAPNPAMADGENPSSEMELLLSSGKLLQIAWDQIKWVCFVRELATGDASAADSASPERLLRRRFSSRPRTSGLWLRLTLVDGEELEGIAANDKSLVDGAGLLLTPPDTRSNTQRVFVPSTSIRELTVLAVIQPATPRADRPIQQPELFVGEPAALIQSEEPIRSSRSVLPFHYNR